MKTAKSRDPEINPIFSREPVRVPRYAMPDGEMEPDTAHQVARDELMLDSHARQNLATFVSTWAEPQARRLMAGCAEKNMIDKEECPRTAGLGTRCVHMPARLWRAENPRQAVGCSTTGSSEAAALGGLALERRRQHRRRESKAAGPSPGATRHRRIKRLFRDEAWEGNDLQDSAGQPVSRTGSVPVPPERPQP